MTPVLDASLYLAAITPTERHHARAVALFDSHPMPAVYLVPALFRVEVIALLARRGEVPEVLDIVDAAIRGSRFATAPLDDGLLDEAARIARTAGVRAYDAVYVALASLRSAPLYTLDGDVIARIATSVPEVTTRSTL